MKPTKLLLGILTFFFTTLLCSAQKGIPFSKDFDITVGAPYKVIDASEKQYFNFGDSLLVAVKYSRGHISVQRFDTEKVTQLSVASKDLGEAKFQEIVKTKNFLHVFSVDYDRKAQTALLKVNSIDVKTGEISGSKRLLKSESEIESYNYRFYFFKLSENQEKLLIHYKCRRKDKEDMNYRVGVLAFSEDLNFLWGGEHVVGSRAKESYYTNLGNFILNDGTIVLFNVNNQLEFFKVKEGGSVEQVSVPGHLFKDVDQLQIAEEKPGEFLFVGAKTNEKGSYNYTHAFVIMRIGVDGKPRGVRNITIPKKLVEAFESEREKKRSKKREEKGLGGIVFLSLKDFTMHDDGSVTIVAEQRHSVTTCNGKGSCTTTYYFNDVVVLKVGADDQMLWATKLPKNQSSRSYEGGAGIYYAFADGQHYIYHLDNLKNTQISSNQAPKNYVDGKAGLMTVWKVGDQDGKITRDFLFNTANVGGTKIKLYQLRTYRMINIGGALFMEAYVKKKQDRMIRITRK